jgi:hypothetical protein
VIDDREVLDLLRDDPELLAIADAVQQTQQGLRPSRQSRRRVGVVAAVAACLAAAAAGAFVLRPTAHAGVPAGKFIHVIVKRQMLDTWLVPLAGGPARHSVVSTETWLRADGGKSWTINRIDGTVVDAGTFTPFHATSILGPVVMSPNPSAGSAVQPMVAVYDGYDQALQHGGRRARGSATVDGVRVRWVAFNRGPNASAVALDDNGVPRAVSDASNRSIGKIATYETVDEPGALPRPHGRVAGRGDSSPGRPVSPAEAATAVPGVLWAGRGVAGLPLRTVLVERLTQRGVPGSRQGVELRYGQAVKNPLALTPFLYLWQARRPERAYGFPGIGGVGLLPPNGYVRVTQLAPEARTTVSTGFVKYRGVYLQLRTNLSLRQLTDIVRRLQRVS